MICYNCRQNERRMYGKSEPCDDYKCEYNLHYKPNNDINQNIEKLFDVVKQSIVRQSESYLNISECGSDKKLMFRNWQLKKRDNST